MESANRKSPFIPMIYTLHANGPRGDFYKNMFAKCPAGRPETADEVANVADCIFYILDSLYLYAMCRKKVGTLKLFPIQVFLVAVAIAGVMTALKNEMIL